MKITVLGCGASVGTPAAGGFWGNCDPKEPKNNRTRASLLVQDQDTNILIDTTVDARQQLTRHQIQKLDAVLYSHCHSDHINGMDDLRVISYQNGAPIDMYANQHTLSDFETRFHYAAHGGMGGVYKPFLKPHTLQEYDQFQVNHVDVTCFPQKHANVDSVGFRFGDFAYCVDVVDLDDKALESLEGIDTWIVDGAGYNREDPITHANFERVFKWVELLKPKMTYLTVMTNFMDYKTVSDELPPHIQPCYDNMIIEIN